MPISQVHVPTPSTAAKSTSHYVNPTHKLFKYPKYGPHWTSNHRAPKSFLYSGFIYRDHSTAFVIRFLLGQSEQDMLTHPDKYGSGMSLYTSNHIENTGHGNAF